MFIQLSNIICGNLTSVQRLGCHFSFVLLALTFRGAVSYLLGIYFRPLFFFSLFPCLPTPPPCRTFSLPLILLAHLSFYLSHAHFASLSNELKSSHIPLSHLLRTSFLPLSVFFQSARTPLAHSPHFSCEIKAALLVCNHNAIAPLSHPLCTPIAVLFNPFLKTSSV